MTSGSHSQPSIGELGAYRTLTAVLAQLRDLSGRGLRALGFKVLQALEQALATLEEIHPHLPPDVRSGPVALHPLALGVVDRVRDIVQTLRRVETVLVVHPPEGPRPLILEGVRKARRTLEAIEATSSPPA